MFHWKTECSIIAAFVFSSSVCYMHARIFSFISLSVYRFSSLESHNIQQPVSLTEGNHSFTTILLMIFPRNSGQSRHALRSVLDGWNVCNVHPFIRCGYVSLLRTEKKRPNARLRQFRVPELAVCRMWSITCRLRSTPVRFRADFRFSLGNV